MRCPNQKHIFPVESKVYRDSASITKVEIKMLNANLIVFFSRLRLASHVTIFFANCMGIPAVLTLENVGLRRLVKTNC